MLFTLAPHIVRTSFDITCAAYRIPLNSMRLLVSVNGNWLSLGGSMLWLDLLLLAVVRVFLGSIEGGMLLDIPTSGIPPSDVRPPVNAMTLDACRHDFSAFLLDNTFVKGDGLEKNELRAANGLLGFIETLTLVATLLRRWKDVPRSMKRLLFDSK